MVPTPQPTEPHKRGQLCLYLKVNGSLVLADKYGNEFGEITVIETGKNQTRLMLELDADVQAWRREIWDAELAKGAAA